MLFNGAVTTPLHVRLSPVDSWGNVKVPKIELYEKSSKPDSEGWYPTNNDHNDTGAYISFVGIPTRINKYGFDRAKTEYSIHLQTPYMNLKCVHYNLTTNNDELISNASRRLPQNSQNVTADLNAMFWWMTPNVSTHQNASTVRIPFNFTFEPHFKAPPRSFRRYGLDCAVTNTYVETAVFCPANSICRATKVRRSQLAAPPPEWTYFNMPGRESSRSNFFKAFASLANATGFYSSDHIIKTVFDKYLTDPSLSNLSVSEEALNLPIPSDEEYSIRMAQLLNSYFLCSSGRHMLIKGINPKTSFWDSNQTFIPLQATGNGPGLDAVPGESRVWTYNGTVSVQVEILVAHKWWVAVLAISSTVLILAGMVSPLIHHFLVKGPDVAMTLSSLVTRGNPFVRLPDTGTALDAAERAKLLRDVRVRFGDVEGDKEVGFLAIASYDGDSEVANPREDRLYC